MRDVNDIIPLGTKKLGRPRAFDCERVLTAAQEVFWAKGYDGASLDDLTEAMGINRPSLYGAFGDKKSLFLRVLDFFAEGIGSEAIRAFCNECDIHKAVEQFFEVSLECQTHAGAAAKGCLLASAGSISAGSVPEACAKLNSTLKLTQSMIEARFNAEIEAGHLPPNFSVASKAVIMLDLMQAQAQRAAAGEDKATLAAQIAWRVDAVLA